MMENVPGLASELEAFSAFRYDAIAGLLVSLRGRCGMNVYTERAASPPLARKVFS